MSLQEAKQFVAHFVSGDYTPEEYATFLQWLRGASFDELNEIADEHEALHERWSLPVSAPSPEWVAMLEGKLDELGKEADEAPLRHIGTRVVGRRVLRALPSGYRALNAGWPRQLRAWLLALHVPIEQPGDCGAVCPGE